MTLGGLLKSGKERLRAAHISEWDLDAWYLLEYVTGCTKNKYFLDPDQSVSEEEERRYGELIGERSRHIPLQYLTGIQEFMGLPFHVNADVLIPRQDTEILVETACGYMRPGMHILDLCTGSGCILLSVISLCSYVTGLGTDLSKRALCVAETNAAALQIPAVFLQSDLFEKIDGSFDRILSNPPYIPSETMDTLMEEVRDHEPRMALDGQEDGLYFYRKIVEQSPAHLKPGGMLFFEIGYDQAEAVTGLMEENFAGIQVVKDLSGLDRVIYGTLRT